MGQSAKKRKSNDEQIYIQEVSDSGEFPQQLAHLAYSREKRLLLCHCILNECDTPVSYLARLIPIIYHLQRKHQAHKDNCEIRVLGVYCTKR